ncbi:MAG TPA: PilZ domain-containing protein [Planctomycetota bacterium]|nr:PilZ domain-containing protein [Planctomycetota bacterium]
MSAPTRPSVERRRYRRFELSAPLVFTVKTKAGTSVSHSGITRNVSPGGLYFCTLAAQDLHPQQEVTVNIIVPRRGNPSEATVSLSGEARVVRAERLPASADALARDGEWWGVAAQFTGRPRVDLSSVDDLFGGT